MITPLLLIALQDEPESPGNTIGEHAFWWTVFLIFAIAVIGALMRLRERDKCLKLLSGHRVTYLGGRAATLWGTLHVVNRGLELAFDAPRSDSREITKSSTLLYEDEYSASVAICRVQSGSSDEKSAERKVQVERTFAPSRLRRYGRATRNVIYTIRDAFTKTLGMMTGQVARTRGVSKAVESQRRGIDEFNQSVVSFVGNAYEQLLERQVGKPVVLELDPPPGSGTDCLELPGYLVDYTDRFLAVFNVEHEPLESFVVEFTGSRDENGVRARVERGTLTIASRHDEPLVISHVEVAGEKTDLSVCLLKGCEITLPCKDGEEVRIHVAVTRCIDIVCSRANGRIRHGGGEIEAVAGWTGAAPNAEAQLSISR